MFKRNIIRIVLSIILLILAIFLPISELSKFILYLLSYLIIGYDILFKAVKNIFSGKFLDENFLMGLATIGAFCIKDYKEASFVMIFYQVGELFQHLAIQKSRTSITSLMDLRPDIALILKDDKPVEINPEELKVGDLIIVKPGDKIPVDGIVIEGNSTLDTSKLTGETLPKEVDVNDYVLSGSINVTKTLKIKVDKEFGDSTASKILDLVENASFNKAKSENFITKFARIYTPVVVFLAILLAFVPPLVLGFKAHFDEYLLRALSFLVISCPCALVISVPLGFFAGIGLSAKNNILVKGSNYLEALSSVKYFVFDKTGTLTKGNFKVQKVVTNKATVEEVLSTAVIAESDANHPIGKALKDYYQGEIDTSPCENFEQIAGFGVIVKYYDDELIVGNEKLMIAKNIDYLPTTEVGTIVHVAKNTKYLGYIIIRDEIKEDSKETIQKLKALGIKKCVMLTGDHVNLAQNVAKELALDEVYAELLPNDKVDLVAKFQSQKLKNEKLAFVGDGINDAPVLALSDVGISMGGLGSDAAIEASDIVLMKDEMKKIPTAVKISKKTLTIVKENILFTIFVKILVLILGAFGIVGMPIAIFADVGVCIIAVLNSIRLLKIKLNK